MIYTSEGRGKTEGLQSINVDTTTNPFCQSQQKRGIEVCQHCYSQKSLTGYGKRAVTRYRENAEMLRMPYPIPFHLVPKTKLGKFRLFSHGDVEDDNMAKNILYIVKCNPQTVFTAWSKNTAAWRHACNELGKPENLILIFSVSRINNFDAKIPRPFDKKFTVISPDKSDMENCTGKCMHCPSETNCYEKGGVDEIYEILKNRGRPVKFYKRIDLANK